MSKAKRITCQLYRSPFNGNYCSLISSGWATMRFCWDTFGQCCPALTRGLRPGQSRKLVLTQTPKGIRLERAKK